MSEHYDFFEFELEGVCFEARIYPDDWQRLPWEEECGHGPVRCVRSRDEKRPGERPLHNDRGDWWLYDWAEACKMARKDGWNAPPYDAPNRIERAVQADFDRMRRFLQQDWCYVGIGVALAGDDDASAPSDGDFYENAIWGVESDDNAYLREVAEDLARPLLAEMEEASYWRERDVLTA